MGRADKQDREPIKASNIAVVIAAYNENAAIEGVVCDLLERSYKVVVVDDGSCDNTARIAKRAGATVLRHAVNRGQGAALQTGITYALRREAEVIITFDADGQHRVEDIPSMISPIGEGRAQIVLGSRFLDKNSSVPAGRRLLLKAAVLFTRLTSGMILSDAHNGFRAFSARAAAAIDLQLDRMAHASEIIDQIKRCGLPYMEVPVTIRYTDYSLAKGQSSANAVKVAIDYLLGKLLR